MQHRGREASDRQQPPATGSRCERAMARAPGPPLRQAMLGHRSGPAVVPGPMLRCLALIVMLVAACSAAGSPGPTILPGPSGGGTLSSAELRLRLIDQLGPRWYCDPDFYPIAVNDEMTRMRTRWAEVLADGEALEAILQHEGLASVAVANLTDDQRLAVYRDWK